MDIMKKTKIEQYLQGPLWALLILAFVDIVFFFLDIRCGVILAVSLVVFLVFQMIIYSRSKQEIIKECMDFMIDILQQNKAVKSGFRESVYKREELGDTVLENSVALPHGDPATVINTSIIIMTLTNPIKWGNNYVDMIVMLAVPNNMESEFNQIVLEIYDLVSNKNIINEIKKIANRADFINSLKE